LDEIGIVSIQGLVVVNPSVCPLSFRESVGTESCHLHELVNELLLNADGIVGSQCVDSPLEAILFRMVLGHEVRIVVCFHSGNKLNSVLGEAC